MIKMFIMLMMANLVSKKAIWDQLLWVGCFATNGALKFGGHEISSVFSSKIPEKLFIVGKFELKKFTK